MTDWRSAAESAIGAAITHLSGLGGGDFATAYRATLGNGQTAFIKTHPQPPPGFFTTEAAGLKLTHATATVRVPDVLAVSDDPPFLALEWIEPGHARSTTDAEFGRQLAFLHNTPLDHFGRQDGRTTGSLALPNTPCSTWLEFFRTRRLQPLAVIATERNALPTKTLAALENVIDRLDEFANPDEPPSLLHGDLWAGNRMIDHRGVSWLIDPATHGGHREFDLAMMRLFGGFGEECFAAYDEQYPLADNWQERIDLHQLAPLIVHAIKFAGPYPAAVARALSRYTQ